MWALCGAGSRPCDAWICPQDVLGCRPPVRGCSRLRIIDSLGHGGNDAQKTRAHRWTVVCAWPSWRTVLRTLWVVRSLGRNGAGDVFGVAPRRTMGSMITHLTPMPDYAQILASGTLSYRLVFGSPYLPPHNHPRDCLRGCCAPGIRAAGIVATVLSCMIVTMPAARLFSAVFYLLRHCSSDRWPRQIEPPFMPFADEAAAAVCGPIHTPVAYRLTRLPSRPPQGNS